MANGGGTALFVLVFLFILGMFIFALWSNNKRHEKLQEWAQARGWSYAKTDRDLARRWDTIPFTRGRGNSASAKNVIWGPAQIPGGTTREMVTFTFTYTVTTGSGDNQSSTTYNHHVMAIFIGATTPTITLTPEGLGTKFSKLFGGQDIQFESEDFNKAWRIEAADLRFAHDIVHPRMMELLLQPNYKGLKVVFAGDCVLVFNDRQLEVEAIDPLIWLAGSVVDQIPPHVWAEIRGS